VKRGLAFLPHKTRFRHPWRALEKHPVFQRFYEAKKPSPFSQKTLYVKKISRLGLGPTKHRGIYVQII